MSNKKTLSRVVILGSKSFIGKSLIKNLKNKKIEVIEISRDEVNFSKKEACLELKKFIKDDDSIFFVAARAPVKDIDMFIYNIRICQNIFEIIINFNINHLIYVSSDAVYKDTDKLID